MCDLIKLFYCRKEAEYIPLQDPIPSSKEEEEEALGTTESKETPKTPIDDAKSCSLYLQWWQ